MTEQSSKYKLSTRLSAELIEEEFQLSDTQQNELNQLYEDISNKFQVGKVITGKIINKDGSGVLVGIDYKSDGLIPNYEFTHYELQELAPNSEIDVLLDRLEDENGVVVLSYQKAKALKAWNSITDLAAEDKPVRGVVTHKVKGGLSVDVGIPAFLPGSQIDVQRVTDFDQFVGQEVVCKILKVNKKRGNIIISRRKYIEEQRFEDKKKALETIAEDQVLQGAVKNITSYGVFVDVGGIDGLLHITDMSWGRISHPSELVKIGDTITVKVISFDKMHEKISLGMKQLSENPWEQVEEKYPIGQKVEGRVSSIADYGLFIEVEKGVEGLIHISEISWTERINNLSKHYAIGDKLEAVVVALDKDNRRMSLSIKQLQEDPWKAVAEKFNVGDIITGTISNITDFGLFVQVFDGVDGLIHISDISWTDHVTHPSERYKKSDELKAIILAIDVANRKISLGIKQLEKDPWEDIASQYSIGSMVEGTVSKITTFGAFVKLPTGIEGLVHISELSDKEISKVEDILKVGETKEFRVIKVSPEERKLGLSLKPEKKQTPAEETPKAVEKAEAKETKKPHLKKPEQFKQPKSPKSSLQQALEEHIQKQNDKESK